MKNTKYSVLAVLREWEIAFGSNFVLDDEPYDSNIFISRQVYLILEPIVSDCFKQKDHHLCVPIKNNLKVL